MCACVGIHTIVGSENSFTVYHYITVLYPNINIRKYLENVAMKYVKYTYYFFQYKFELMV